MNITLLHSQFTTQYSLLHIPSLTIRNSKYIINWCSDKLFQKTKVYTKLATLSIRWNHIFHGNINTINKNQFPIVYHLFNVSFTMYWEMVTSFTTLRSQVGYPVSHKGSNVSTKVQINSWFLIIILIIMKITNFLDVLVTWQFSTDVIHYCICVQNKDLTLVIKSVKPFSITFFFHTWSLVYT